MEYEKGWYVKGRPYSYDSWGTKNGIIPVCTSILMPTNMQRFCPPRLIWVSSHYSLVWSQIEAINSPILTSIAFCLLGRFFASIHQSMSPACSLFPKMLIIFERVDANCGVSGKKNLEERCRTHGDMGLDGFGWHSQFKLSLNLFHLSLMALLVTILTWINVWTLTTVSIDCVTTVTKSITSHLTQACLLFLPVIL